MARLSTKMFIILITYLQVWLLFLINSCDNVPKFIEKRQWSGEFQSDSTCHGSFSDEVVETVVQGVVQENHVDWLTESEGPVNTAVTLQVQILQIRW